MKSDEIWTLNDRCMVNPLVFSPEPNEFRPSRWLPIPVINVVTSTENGVEVVGESEVVGGLIEGSLPEQLVEMEKSFFAFGGGPRICPGINSILFILIG